MKISLKTLLFALIQGATQTTTQAAVAPEAETATRIADEPDLTTLAGRDFSTATTIIIDNCLALETLDGLIAPMATMIRIVRCNNLRNLAGLNVPAATTISIRSCPKLKNLAGLNAPTATTIDISWCRNLTSLAGLNAPAATTIKIRWCDRLTSLDGLNAPLATTIKTDPFLQAEANEIVRQNLAWSGPRAAWCSTVGRITEARNGTRAAI